MLTGNTFVDPLEMPFSRRGSYLCLANANGGSNAYARAQLWLANARQRPLDRNRSTIFNSNRFRQIKLELVKNGIPLPSVISTTPYELTLSSTAGSVSFCIGDIRYVQCKGMDGLTLRMSAQTGMIGPLTTYAAFDLLDGTWKANFGNYYVLFVPVRGTLRAGRLGTFELVPDDRGVIEMVMEECVTEPKRRETYLSYEAGLAAVKADFDRFAAAVAPVFPDKYRKRGLQALWTVWGLTAVPSDGTVFKRQMVRMVRSCFEGAFSWQQAMHAMFLAHDRDFAWELLLSCFDHQNSSGRIADSVTYTGYGETAKPPVQGLALLWLMEHDDISNRPQAELEFLYEGLARWTEFHLNYRDMDHDGLFENHHAGETGWESCTFYSMGFPLASPDASAYLALQEEALSKLGRILGKSAVECDRWEKQAAETIRKIINVFWTDNGWEAVNIATGECGGATSLIPKCTLVLGKRLPQEIIDKTIARIFGQPGYNTPYGLASEELDSPYFRHGWCGGSIATPVQAIMAVAFENCGRPDLSRVVAREYLDTLSERGFYHINDPFTGKPETDAMRMSGEAALFYSGWTAGNYIFFVERYGYVENAVLD